MRGRRLLVVALLCGLPVIGYAQWASVKGTNFRKAGTLATGTTSARFFSVTFICLDGTIWQEIARTAVLS